MMNKDIEEILITNKQIKKECKKFGKIISKDYETKDLVLVGLLKGCVLFFSELAKNITVPLTMDFMVVSSYVNTSSTGKVDIKKDISMNIINKDILIIEDIIDTGKTLDLVIEHLKKLGARSVEVITLLNKIEGRIIKNIEPKYALFNIPNKFVVGYGLDYNEYYRNLDYIGVLKECVYKK